MYQLSGSTKAALDYNSTIIGALELSEKKWVLAVQLPGVSRYSRHVLEACGDGLRTSRNSVRFGNSVGDKDAIVLCICAERPSPTARTTTKSTRSATSPPIETS